MSNTNEAGQHPFALLGASRSSWHRLLGGIDTRPEQYSSEEEYTRAINLSFSRITSFIILMCLILFYPFDLVYLEGQPEKLWVITRWRIGFGGTVGLTWLWARFLLKPENFTLNKWISIATLWAFVGIGLGSQIGPFHEPWMALFLLSPFGSMFLVMKLYQRTLFNISFMLIGLLMLYRFAPDYFMAPLFPTYLVYAVLAIAMGTLFGNFFDRVTREHFQSSTAVQEQQAMLEQLVQVRTKEAQKALQELESSQRRVHNSVSHGLQNELGHLIVLHNLSLHQFMSDNKDNPNVVEASQTFLKELQQIEEGTRRVVAESNYGVSSDIPLGQALREWLTPYQKQQELRVEWVVEPEELLLQEQLLFVLYRLVQETMTNIRKHAKANKVEVSLLWNKEALTLTIIDDGQGFDTSTRKSGFGLKGIAERVSLVGGEYKLRSNQGGGTEVTAVFPSSTLEVSFSAQEVEEA